MAFTKEEERKVEKLAKIIDGSKRIVFFGGAGVSTESGIPDFRSQDGLYHMKYDYPPETILSASFFYAHTEEFYKFYRDKMLCLAAKPNSVHLKLAAWEREGKLSAIVTQNIDGLHQMAGNKKVYELHGTVLKNRCLSCGRKYRLEAIGKEGIPRCSCGGIIKPEVVLYEEQLPDDAVYGALEAIKNADTMIVAGTSLTVYPAAGFLNYFEGDHLVLINRDETAYDNRCEIVLHKKLGEVFEKL